MFAVMQGKRPPRPGHPLSRTRGLNDKVWHIITACWDQDPDARPTASKVVEYFRGLPNQPSDHRPPNDFDKALPSRVLSAHNRIDHPFSTLALRSQDIDKMYQAELASSKGGDEHLADNTGSLDDTFGEDTYASEATNPKKPLSTTLTDTVFTNITIDPRFEDNFDSPSVGADVMRLSNGATPSAAEIAYPWGFADNLQSLSAADSILFEPVFEGTFDFASARAAARTFSPPMVGGNGNLPSFMKPKPAELVIIRAIRAKGELPGPASVEASFIPSWTPNATLPVFYDTDFFSSSSRLQVSLRRISSIFSSTTPPWSILSSPRVDSYEELAELVSQPGRHSARVC
jgi:hypothetical protein